MTDIKAIIAGFLFVLLVFGGCELEESYQRQCAKPNIVCQGHFVGVYPE